VLSGRRALTALLVLLLVFVAVFLGWNMQKKELAGVKIVFSGTSYGTLKIFSDFSYQLNCSDPVLKKHIGQALDQIIAEDNAMLRTEDMVNGVLIMKGEYLNRKDKNFVHALLYNAADRTNAALKSGFLTFEY
jgi:hypothetical protein